MKYPFETISNLPSQSSDPKHEITVDATGKEDVVVGKINSVESVELVKPKDDAEREVEETKKKRDERNPPLKHFTLGTELDSE